MKNLNKLYERAMNARVYGNNADTSKAQNELLAIIKCNYVEGNLTRKDANYVIENLNQVRTFLGWQAFATI